MEPYLVLGLDAGIGSCGWAILDTANKRVVDMGVHLWKPPQEPKTKVSTATTRRLARSSRRNNRRTKNRLKHCKKLFEEYELIPVGADANYLQSRKGDKPVLKLRSCGLIRMLSAREWAQVLYNLCERRGYIAHGVDASDTEGRKVLGAIDSNKELMAQSGYRTVGEMFYANNRSRNKGGDYSLCVSIEQIIDEAKVLFDCQRQFGSSFASEDFERRYLTCLTWQKDISANDERTYSQVGMCAYFENEKRAASCCLSSEMCIAYERVGHVRYIDQDGTEKALSPATRQQAIEILFSPVALPKNKKCKVTYALLRQMEDLSTDAMFKGVDREVENKTEVFVPKIWAELREKLPQNLVVRMRENRELADEICSALAYSSCENSLLGKLEEADLSDEDVQALLLLPYDTKKYSGYGARSLKALNLLIDAFEDVEDIVTLYDAEHATGLDNKRLSKPNQTCSLPIYAAFDPTCKNPVVLRVMGRVRKLVNAILSEYGMMNEIHVELARELKHSKKEKDNIAKNNKKRFDTREIAKRKLAEELGCDKDAIPGKLLRKYELWLEQGGIDIYTGEKIEYERLLKDLEYCEIDHILPYSRTCDDGQMNKVLALNASNQNKKARTPYEWMSEDGLDWDGYKLRVQRLTNYPSRKKEKLLNVNLSAQAEADFIARNLNDTRYASRSTKNYIEQYLAFPDGEKKQHVFAVSGGATSILRSAWGIQKVREDNNLHHAVDAAVIAACTPSMVQKVARASESKKLVKKEQRKILFEQIQPWEGFSLEVQEYAAHIMPTRMQEHGLTGRLFEDFTYTYIGLNESGTVGVLSRSGTEKVSSNYVLQTDGSAKIVDGLAFVRLWWNPEIRKTKGKPVGQYLVEPVYYADIPAVFRDDYKPKLAPLQSDKKPREKWDVLSDELMAQKPIVLFPGDAISVKGMLRRFNGFNISTNAWNLLDLTGEMTGSEATKGLAIASIRQKDDLILVQEDILGHCYRER